LRTDFERITVKDFWEIGASGQCYSLEFILNELEKRFSAPHKDVWETKDFQCLKLADDEYLLTYTLIQDETRVTDGLLYGVGQLMGGKLSSIKAP
jgi:hypothetical protein